MARILKESHSFICKTRVHPLMNLNLPLPSSSNNSSSSNTKSLSEGKCCHLFYAVCLRKLKINVNRKNSERCGTLQKIVYIKVKHVMRKRCFITNHKYQADTNAIVFSTSFRSIRSISSSNPSANAESLARDHKWCHYFNAVLELKVNRDCKILCVFEPLRGLAATYTVYLRLIGNLVWTIYSC